MGIVYLIRFEEPISDRHTCQYYMGYTSKDSLRQRLNTHRVGHGANLIRVAQERNIRWRVVRVWRDVNRSHERQLKRQHNHRLLDPFHNPNALKRARFGRIGRIPRKEKT